jgi:DNA-directed RNA polymerase subunit N (RpoN/RPB10)
MSNNSCDTVNICKRCGNQNVGLIYPIYKEELKKIINANHADPNDLLISAEVDIKDNRIRDLLDDLMIFTTCCRITIMSSV